MELTTLYDGTEDVGELWHRVREETGIEDNGSGEGADQDDPAGAVS